MQEFFAFGVNNFWRRVRGGTSIRYSSRLSAARFNATQLLEPRAPVEIGGARRPAAIAWAQPFWLYPRHILADRRDKPDPARSTDRGLIQ
jgi:hypothetical protein